MMDSQRPEAKAAAPERTTTASAMAAMAAMAAAAPVVALVTVKTLAEIEIEKKQILKEISQAISLAQRYKENTDKIANCQDILRKINQLIKLVNLENAVGNETRTKQDAEFIKQTLEFLTQSDWLGYLPDTIKIQTPDLSKQNQNEQAASLRELLINIKVNIQLEISGLKADFGDTTLMAQVDEKKLHKAIEYNPATMQELYERFIKNQQEEDADENIATMSDLPTREPLIDMTRMNKTTLKAHILKHEKLNFLEQLTINDLVESRYAALRRRHQTDTESLREPHPAAATALAPFRERITP